MSLFAPEGDLMLALSEPDVEVIEAATEDTLIDDDLLVEDVSIDGMCGVY
jgi:mycofactocin precursor